MTISLENAKRAVASCSADVVGRLDGVPTVIGQSDKSDTDKLAEIATLAADARNAMGQIGEAMAVIDKESVSSDYFGYLALGLMEMGKGLREDAADPPVFAPGEPVPPDDGLITLRKSVLLRYAAMAEAMLKQVVAAAPDAPVPP